MEDRKKILEQKRMEYETLAIAYYGDAETALRHLMSYMDELPSAERQAAVKRMLIDSDGCTDEEELTKRKIDRYDLYLSLLDDCVEWSYYEITAEEKKKFLDKYAELEKLCAEKMGAKGSPVVEFGKTLHGSEAAKFAGVVLIRNRLVHGEYAAATAGTTRLVGYCIMLVRRAYATEGEKALMITLEEVGLTTRAHNCLARAGISSLYELTQMTEAELMAVKNLGLKGGRDVVEKLAERGLTLKK